LDLRFSFHHDFTFIDSNCWQNSLLEENNIFRITSKVIICLEKITSLLMIDLTGHDQKFAFFASGVFHRVEKSLSENLENGLG